MRLRSAFRDDELLSNRHLPAQFEAHLIRVRLESEFSRTSIGRQSCFGPIPGADLHTFSHYLRTGAEH
jgi:hypothetical protein